MQWNQSTMYEQRVRFILEVQQGTFSYGARIKGCGVPWKGTYSWWVRISPSSCCSDW